MPEYVEVPASETELVYPTCQPVGGSGLPAQRPATRIPKVSRAGGLILLLTACAALYRLLGFVRELLIAHQFGTSLPADAYIAALYLPQFFLILLANNTLAPSLIPFLLRPEAEGEWERINAAFNTFAGLGLLLSGFLLISAPWLTAWMFPGLSGTALLLTIRLSQCMAPAVFFLLASVALSAVFQTKEKFMYPAVSGILSVAVMVLSVIAAPHLWGVYTLALGVTAGAALQLGILFAGLVADGWEVSARRSGFAWMPIAHGLPLLFVTFCFVALDLLARMFASKLPEGSISSLIYAMKLAVLPGAIFGIPLTTVVFPRLAHLSQAREHGAHSMVSTQVLALLLVVMAPLAVLAFILRRPVVEVLFHRGMFNEHSVWLTSSALAGLAPAILFGPFTVVLQTLFYSRGDRRTPVVSCIPLLVAMGLGGSVMGRFWGIAGIAASYSIAWMAAALFLLLRSALDASGSEIRRGIFWSAQTLLAAVACGAVTARLLPGNSAGDGVHLPSLALAAGMYLPLYLLLLGLFNSRSARLCMGVLRSLIRRLPVA